jgi:hypothetical protein
MEIFCIIPLKFYVTKIVAAVDAAAETDNYSAAAAAAAIL